MTDPYDSKQSMAQLEEIRILSARRGFDLYEYLSLLADDGLVALDCKIDALAASRADGIVVHYKLCERLNGLLAALRAWDQNELEIELAARRGGSSAPLRRAITRICGRFSHHKNGVLAGIAPGNKLRKLIAFVFKLPFAIWTPVSRFVLNKSNSAPKKPPASRTTDCDPIAVDQHGFAPDSCGNVRIAKGAAGVPNSRRASSLEVG
jgi:hypothetical protein